MENIVFIHFLSSIKMAPPLILGNTLLSVRSFIFGIPENIIMIAGTAWKFYIHTMEVQINHQQILRLYQKTYFIWNDTNQAIMTEVKICQETQLPQLRREQTLKHITVKEKILYQLNFP